MAEVYSPFDLDDPGVFPGERETLLLLQHGLPKDFTVIHSANWVRRNNPNRDTYGEVDFVVVAPAGNALLIEQKNGALSWEDGKPVKRYDQKNCFPLDQLTRSRHALMSLWQKGGKNAFLDLKMMLYLPDFFVRRFVPAAIGIPIIDSDKKPTLCDTIVGELNNPLPRPQQASADTIIHFFLSVFDYRLNIGAMLERQEASYQWRQNQVSQLISQLRFAPFYLLVEGAAGTGKTQLAIDFFMEDLSLGRKPLYLCQTRQLADSMAKALNQPTQVCTLDAWAYRYEKAMTHKRSSAERELLAKALGESDIYYENLLKNFPPDDRWLQDTLILDEGQDITQAQFHFAQQFLKPEGRLLVCRDSNQQTLPSNSFTFAPTVALTLTESYRCSEEILDFTQRFTGMVPGRTMHEERPDMWASYKDADDMLKQIETRIHYYLENGYTLDQIVVLTAQSQNHSVFNRVQNIGSWPLNWYEGAYSTRGNQVYREGDLKVDTLFRFKGLQSPVVILVEIDSNEWAEHRRRRFYTGCTRARMELQVLMTEGAKGAWDVWRVEALAGK